jgi:hypothetical protein
MTSICGTPAGSWRDAVELEPRQGVVVAHRVTLALEYVYLDPRLVVGEGSEYTALAGRDRAVAVDERGEGPIVRLDAERVRCDVEEDEVLHLAG